MHLNVESPSRPDLALVLAAIAAAQAAEAIGGEAVIGLSGGELSVGLTEPGDGLFDAFRAGLGRALGPSYEVVEAGDRLMIGLAKPAGKAAGDKGHGK